MLADDIIMPPFVSPVVLCRMNNGKGADDPEAWKFAIGYRKLKAITQYQIPV